MISKKLEDAINLQINAEMWSANLYLSMSFHLGKEGYEGIASWMKKQYQEELEHALKFADYLIIREGTAKVDKIDVVPCDWGTPLEIFEHTLSHEKHISKLINHLVELAEEEKDYATQDLLSWFINEQIEEEATARRIVKKLQIAGPAGVYQIDQELAQRL